MLLLPWLTFVDFVNLREASKVTMTIFKKRDMLRIMRKRLSYILYHEDAELGEKLLHFLEDRGLYLSGSTVLGLIFHEYYYGDIDLFYHNSINKDWNEVIGSYTENSDAEFMLMRVDEMPHFPDVQIIKNMSHHSKLNQLSTHEILTGGFDLSYVKNTVSFVNGIFTIEISDRSTLLKKGRIDNHYNTNYKTIERIAKYKERGFHTDTSAAIYTCMYRVHPTASMIIDLLPQKPADYIHDKGCRLTYERIKKGNVPHALDPVSGHPVCLIHSALRNNALHKHVAINLAIASMLNNA